MKEKLLCFDLDGTLINSAHDVVSAMNETLTEYERSPLDAEIIISYIGEGLFKLVSDVFKETLDQSKIHEISERFLINYEKHMFETTTVYPGVFDFFNQWQGPVCIITNKNINPTHKILRHLNLDKINWQIILGADSLAEKKPSPLPLKTVMQQLNFQPEDTWMIGDGTPDLISAQAAGVNSVAIGFGFTEISKLTPYNPRFILNHYDNLHELLKSY